MATVSDARSKLVILGIGDDGLAGLTEPARRILMDADVILGAPPILALLDGVPARKEPLEPDMSLAMRQVREALMHRRPVLVSGGDPLFYGVARYLCDRLGKDLFEVVPHVSSMQLAFARIKESWEDAYLTSLAGRPIETVVDRIRTAEKIGVFSSDECPPSRLARELLDRGIDYFRAYVCENLGSPDERVTQGELADLAATDFNPLNVVILIRKPNRPDRAMLGSRHRLFGNPDDAFAQSLPKRGLITQAEVRAIALAQLDIRATSVVWDIGAGSGSVAIEAAQLAHQGMVYAVEPELTDVALIQANAESFGVPNVRTVTGRCARDPGDAARSRRHLRGGDRSTGRPGPEYGVRAAGPWGKHGGERGDDRGAGRCLPGAQGAGRVGERLERLDRAGDRADGPTPLRGDRPHIPPGRDQADAGRGLTPRLPVVGWRRDG